MWRSKINPTSRLYNLWEWYFIAKIIFMKYEKISNIFVHCHVQEVFDSEVTSVQLIEL